MKLPKSPLDQRGQAAAVNMQLTLIISLIVAIIVVYQLFISGVGPTDNAGRYIEDNVLDNNWEPNPSYDANALESYNRVVTLAWAGIGLMGVAIIILAASVILGVVRGFGDTRGV